MNVLPFDVLRFRWRGVLPLPVINLELRTSNRITPHEREPRTSNVACGTFVYE
jgi:hypothetical protein